MLSFFEVSLFVVVVVVVVFSGVGTVFLGERKKKRTLIFGSPKILSLWTESERIVR